MPLTASGERKEGGEAGRGESERQGGNISRCLCQTVS